MGHHSPERLFTQLICTLAQVEKSSDDASRACVDVQLPLLSRLGVSKRNISPALATSELEMWPLLVVPSLVRGLQADGQQHDTNRTMTQNETPIL